MQYVRDSHDAHDVLFNRVPVLRERGGGGVLTAGYPAYAVVPPGFAPVAWVGTRETSAALTASFRLVTPTTDYRS